MSKLTRIEALQAVYETIEWKNRFNKPYYIDEPCPDCGNEVQILSDASSDCPDCGHPEVLPCSECPRLEEQICDWNKWTRCSEFPKTDDEEREQIKISGEFK